MTCDGCPAFEPLDHPYLGRCAAGEPPPNCGYWWRTHEHGCRARAAMEAEETQESPVEHSGDAAQEALTAMKAMLKKETPRVAARGVRTK